MNCVCAAAVRTTSVPRSCRDTPLTTRLTADDSLSDCNTRALPGAALQTGRAGAVCTSRECQAGRPAAETSRSVTSPISRALSGKAAGRSHSGAPSGSSGALMIAATDAANSCALTASDAKSSPLRSNCGSSPPAQSVPTRAARQVSPAMTQLRSSDSAQSGSSCASVADRPGAASMRSASMRGNSGDRKKRQTVMIMVKR